MKKIWVKKNASVLLLSFLSVAISLSFLRESPGRSISLAVLISTLPLFYLLTENLSLSFLLFLLLALPFNITYQLPVSFEKSLVEGISVNYLIPTLSILDFGIGIFLIILIMKRRKDLKKVWKDYKYPLTFLILFLLFHNIVLRNPLVLLSSLRIFSYSLTLPILFNQWEREKEQINYKYISIILLLSVTIQGLLGLSQFHRGSSMGLNFLGESQGVAGLVGSSFVSLGGEVFLRASGTFPHPNILAGFFLLALYFAYDIAKKTEKKERLIAYLTMVFSTIFVLFTFSRITIFLFFLSICVFLLSRIYLKRKHMSFTLPLLFERFLNIFSLEDSSWIDRINLAKASFVVIKNNWILGVGSGNFVKGMEGFSPVTSRSMPLLQPVHNIFLLLFSEIGILGVFSLGYFLFEILKKNYKRVTLFGVLIFFSVFVIGMFDHYFVSLPQGEVMFLLFLFLGVISS